MLLRFSVSIQQHRIAGGWSIIEETRDRFKVARLCELLGVSRSGYYAWKSRDVSRHRQQDQTLRVAIKELHQGYRRRYGAARVHQALRQKGLVCSRRRINILMRGMKSNRKVGLYAWGPGHHEFYSAAGNLPTQTRTASDSPWRTMGR